MGLRHPVSGDCVLSHKKGGGVILAPVVGMGLLGVSGIVGSAGGGLVGFLAKDFCRMPYKHFLPIMRT